MTTLKFIFIYQLIVFCSCGQKQIKHKVDPEAIRLSNKIVELSRYRDNIDSCRQAVAYLDSATAINSNYFLGYYNKLMFLYPLNQFDKAVSAVNSCIRIRPYTNDLYLKGGILYEKISDTISARKYFQKSLEIINQILDTMKSRDMNYEMLLINKAINLIMLGNDKMGNDILKSIYSKQKEFTSLFMNKSKSELIELMTTDKAADLNSLRSH